MSREEKRAGCGTEEETAIEGGCKGEEMKTIGLIGGMSWESTLDYYRIINEKTKEALGGFHSAPLVLLSVDFHEIEGLQHAGDWRALTNLMIKAARTLEKAHADLVLICTNTMHLMADDVQNSIAVPLVHIADVAAARIMQSGLKCVGLLGTRFTMEQDFYRGRLEKKFGLSVLIPNEEDRTAVHTVIYEELVAGILREKSKTAFLAIIQKMIEQGAEGIILGCTEIPLLVKQADVSVPVFDTTRIHAESAVAAALGV